jgi:hypothetical protein
MLDRLRRLRLFSRAARLERDVAEIRGFMTMRFTAAGDPISYPSLVARLEPLERESNATGFCVRCGGVFLIQRMRFFQPAKVNGSDGPRLIAACIWCGDIVKRRSGPEVKEPWNHAPAPAEKAS